MRDWKTQPPKNIEDVKQWGRYVLELACRDALAITGQLPHVEDRGDRLVVVWPDGMETNEMTWEDLSSNCGFAE